MFGQEAFQAVGDIAEHERNAALSDQLKAQQELNAANASGDTEAAAAAQQRLDAANNSLDAWADGGMARVALHTIVGGLQADMAGGNIAAGAAGAATSATISTHVKAAIDEAVSGLPQGMQETVANLATNAVDAAAGSAIDNLSGGGQAAQQAATGVDMYNRQLHQDEIALAKKYAKTVQEAAAKEGIVLTESQAEGRIERQLLRWVDGTTNTADGGKEDELVVSTIGMKAQDEGMGMQWDYRDYASLHPSEYNDPTLYSENEKLYSPDLSTVDYGLTLQQLHEQKVKGITAAGETAVALFGGPVGMALVGGVNIGTGANEIANGNVTSGAVDVGLGTLSVALPMAGELSASTAAGKNGAAALEETTTAGGSAAADAAAQSGVPTGSAITAGGTANAATASGLKLDLQTTQAANEVVDSLKATGQLPSNYVTKVEAMQNGWEPGKALNSTTPGGQLGGDVFTNSTNVLPSASGRVWREADIGMSNTMSRSNQLGTRLLYSNDGLLYITTDHYQTVTKIGMWK